MTTDNSEHKPAWRAAWRLDDPDWVKVRQRAWKKVKNSPFIKELLLPNKEDLKRIQNFFLTGSAFDPELPEEDWHWKNYHPDTRPLPVGEATMLIELWLTADDSESNWQHIDDKYSEGSHQSARDRFRDALYRLYPEHGSVFDGREARIYSMLGPTRCRREDYPERSDKAFKRACRSVNAGLGTPIKVHLLSKEPRPDSIAPILAREWCDAVIGAYEYNVILADEKQNTGFIETFFVWVEDIVSASRKIVEDPEQYHPSQVELSQKIITYLSEMVFPQSLQEVLGKYLDLHNG
jgi:hypothetical protein